jgi:hypothetical protein
VSAGPADVAVMPLRFSDAIPAMGKFLSLLGLSPWIVRHDSWMLMAGGSGLAALHDAGSSEIGATAGTTELGFEVEDVEALAERLVRAGQQDVDIYDEAYGRALEVGGEDGLRLRVDERQKDLYGYDGREPTPAPGVVVMPLFFEAPAGPAGPLFTALGLVRRDEGDDEWWRVWACPGGGQVALHPPTAEQARRTSRLGFRTPEPLGVVAARIEAAGGRDIRRLDDEEALMVIDPDGEGILIQPASD